MNNKNSYYGELIRLQIKEINALLKGDRHLAEGYKNRIEMLKAERKETK